MLIRKVASISLVLMCMCINRWSNGVLMMKMTKKSLYLKNSTPLLVDNRSLTSPGMVFGGCSENVDSIGELSCGFVLETRRSPSSPDHLSFCNAVLQSNEEQEEIDNVREVIAFGEDKAIIIWSDHYDLVRFSILYFSDCSITNVDIDEDLRITEADLLTTDEDIFEIILRNDGRSSCTHTKYCKITVDEDGNMVTGLIKWKDNELNEIIAITTSPSKGHLIVDANRDKTVVRVLAGDEVSLVIEEYSGHKNLPHTVAVSNTEEHLTVCYQTNSWTEVQESDGISECSQFDLDGRLKFKTRLNFIVGINSTNIYNLLSGGFILLSEACSLNRDNNCIISLYENLVIVTKINANGKVDGFFGISEFQLDRGLQLNQIHWFINEQQEYCLSAVYEPKQEHSSVDLTILCFDDTDFANSFDWVRM